MFCSISEHVRIVQWFELMHFYKLEDKNNDVVKLICMYLHERFLHFLIEFNKRAKLGIAKLRNKTKRSYTEFDSRKQVIAF